MQTTWYGPNYDIPVSCPNTDQLSSLLFSSEQAGILRCHGVSLVSASRCLKRITIPTSPMVGHFFLDRLILDDDDIASPRNDVKHSTCDMLYSENTCILSNTATKTSNLAILFDGCSSEDLPAPNRDTKQRFLRATPDSKVASYSCSASKS